MNGIIIESFDDFSKLVTAPINNVENIKEKQVTKIKGEKDTILKTKDDNKRIKIVIVEPKEPNEKVRYEFKIVTKNADQQLVRQESLNHIATLITDRIANKMINAELVGFLNVQPTRANALGNTIVSGVLSFYPINIFTNLDKVQPIQTFPVPTQESELSKLPTTSQIVITEETTAVDGVKLYDYSQMAELLAPTAQQSFNLKSASTISTNIPDPVVTTDTTTLAPNATTNTTTLAPNTQTGSYENLTKSLSVNPLVQDLQKRILAKGAVDQTVKPAADFIAAKGGADGKFGDATGRAISLLTKGNPEPPTTTIDKATADALTTKLTGLTQVDLDKVSVKPVTQPIANAPAQPATQQQKPKPGAISVKTPGGATFTINEMLAFNYFSYARHIELLKFKHINEGKLELLKSGVNGGQYKFAWDTAMRGIGTAIDSGNMSGAVKVQLLQNDPNSIFDIKWAMDTNRNVTLYAVGDFTRTAEDDKKAIEISELIDALFKNTAFWKPAKGSVLNFQGGDDERKGQDLYNNWFTSTIRPKLNLMNQQDPNLTAINNADVEIKRKLWGNTGNDTARWTIQTINGPMNYSVDTDF